MPTPAAVTDANGGASLCADTRRILRAICCAGQCIYAAWFSANERGTDHLTDERIASVERLWTAHGDAPFPRRLLYDDVVGIEMVMLDADVSGCIHTC